jgi:DNA-binding MarR family transcriptional regulator
MISFAMEKENLLQVCAQKMIEIIPLLRGSINAHIHSEVDRSQWVTPGQTSLLYLINQGETSISSLAGRQKTSAPTISRQVDCLVEKGLVLRARQSSDRRVVRLVLTEKGSEVLKEIMDSTLEWISSQLNSLETRQLEGILCTFNNLSEIFAAEKNVS